MYGYFYNYVYKHFLYIYLTVVCIDIYKDLYNMYMLRGGEASLNAQALIFSQPASRMNLTVLFVNVPGLPTTDRDSKSMMSTHAKTIPCLQLQPITLLFILVQLPFLLISVFILEL